MYALEFETRTKGRFIELPFSPEFNKAYDLKVIVLSPENLSGYLRKQLPPLSDTLEKIFTEAPRITVDKAVNIDQLCNEVNR